MTSAQRREQLITVARSLFAEKGFEGASIEELAIRAEVSKPVVYEHFGGKEGIYAVVVDREVRTFVDTIRAAIATPVTGYRELIEIAALAMLDYIEQNQDGFRIVARDSSVGSASGSFATILSDIAASVEDLVAESFADTGVMNPAVAPIYSQALVGLVAMAGQWWLTNAELSKEEVAAHLVNLAWHGMAGLEPEPSLRRAKPATPKRRRAGKETT